MTDLRIMIIEDEMIIARDLKRMVQQTCAAEIEIANSSDEAFERYLKFMPHLILCDINLEEKKENGLSVCNKIAEKLQTRFIFITAHSNEDFIKKAGELNALNYLLKPFEEKQVKTTLNIALSNPYVVNGGVLRINYTALFTCREYEILKLISENKTTGQIAAQLFISPKTVENHRGNISKKLALDIQSNSLLKWAIENRDIL